MKKIIFTGGGTGGHIIPNLAVIDELIGKANLFYIGTNGIEKTLTANYVEKKQLTFFEIEAYKFKRKLTFENLILPFRLLKSISQARKILKQIKPDIVFSKGGYVSLPIVIAAKRLKIPCVLHESDITMGLANKLSKRYVTKIFTTFPHAAKNCKKAVCIGSPIRKSIYQGSKTAGLQTMGFDGKRKIITVIGGSQGAKNLNKAIFDNAEVFAKTFDIFVICGKGKANQHKDTKHLHTAEYINNINDIYAATDYVISRAGSNAVCELIALTKPCILVPLTNCTRGEQVLNAKYFASLEAVLIADEHDLTASQLNTKISQLMNMEKQLIANMKKIDIDGTQKIVENVLNA